LEFGDVSLPTFQLGVDFFPRGEKIVVALHLSNHLKEIATSSGGHSSNDSGGKSDSDDSKSNH
jgi:hypothetical protein